MQKFRKQAMSVRCSWDFAGFSWFIEPECPHEVFTIMDGEDTFCHGVVIEAKELPDIHWE